MMKRLFSVLSAVMIALLSSVIVYADEVPVSARAYALYCVENGKLILSRNADEQLPMASTTKIMTSLITLEYAAKDNQIVEFTEDMTAEGSSMYLKVGEKVRLYDLAVGMMMQSGNDAANAAAIAIAGSTEDFASLMNEKARQIGMQHTHFVTPSGLDDEAHYSCAHDMALLMAYALKNEDFAAITAQTEMTVSFAEPADKRVTYPNHNKLLRRYADCIGGKTGYTDRSGRCLVTAARREGLTLICVTLDDRDDWDDHAALYDEGFERYMAVPLPFHERQMPVVGGVSDAVTLYAQDASAVVLRESTDRLHPQVILPTFLYAPVQKGQEVGQVAYILDGETVAETPIRAAQAVEYDNKKRNIIDYIKDLFNWHS